MTSESYRLLMKQMDQGAERREELSQNLEGVRLQLEEVAKIFNVSDDVNVEPVSANGVHAEWISTPVSLPERVMIYTHGGCYISGSARTVREFCSHIARHAEIRVISVDYRIAPEHPFPAALDDTMQVYEYVLAQGYKPENIIISGESAGGGLTVALLMKIRDDGRLPMPALGIPLSPWSDLTLENNSLHTNKDKDVSSVRPLELGAKYYSGDLDPRTPYISPNLGDLSSLPPLLIQVGTNEVLLDDSLKLAKRATDHGVDVTLETYEEMFHVWYWFYSVLEEAQISTNAIGTFIKTRLG